MKIGKIISVEFDKFRVRLFNSTRNSTVNIAGKVYYFGNIGSYLKTANSIGENIFCEVTSIIDWVGKDNQVYSAFNLDSSREMIIKPIGTLADDDFKMGVGIFPQLYSDVEMVTDEDLDAILRNKENNEDPHIHGSIVIGRSKNLINYQISLGVDRFFNIHTAVLGNSGSGKSNTIAHILHEVYRKVTNEALGAKTIIFDANGEYPKAFGSDARLSKSITPVFYKPNISAGDAGRGYQAFHLPYYLMNLDEWLSFLMASERTQKPFWDNVLQLCYKFYMIFNAKSDKDAKKFVNYVKWKLHLVLLCIVTRIDSDTSKMTAAKGAISAMRKACSSKLNDKLDEETKNDFLDYLDICDQLCTINFGNNNDSLVNALKLFVIQESPKYFYLDNISSRGQIVGKLSAARKGKSFLQINENEALEVECHNLCNGEYFDYNYLKTAVEIVLIEEEARGNMRIRDFVSTLISRLEYFLNNTECEFMKMDSQEYLTGEDYLEKVFGVSNSGEMKKQLITIDSSEVGTDILELMTSVVSRLIFDYRKKLSGDARHERPVHLILDEAHRYIHKDANYIMRENIFEKIAREVRKYSLYLFISSQRPSELSQTVLSQCGNYIVHRIQNEVDLKYVYSVLPYFSEDYLSKIKQAVPGEALIFGNCVPMPLMVKVEEAHPAPNSMNCKVSEEWYKHEGSLREGRLKEMRQTAVAEQ